MLATNEKAHTTQNITPVNGPFGNLKSPIQANNTNIHPTCWNPRIQVGIPSRQITKIQITKHHNTSFYVINQVSMYFSVRLETTRSQLFIVTSRTGIKPRCLFKLIPHKPFSLSDNTAYRSRALTSFQSLLHFQSISQLLQHLFSKHLYLTTSPGPAELHTKQYRLSKVNFWFKIRWSSSCTQTWHLAPR